MTVEIWISVAVVFAILSFTRPLFAIAGIVLGLPAYRLQTVAFGIPTTVLESAIVGTIVGWMLKVTLDGFRDRTTLNDRVHRLRVAVQGPLLLFLVVTAAGWIVSTTVTIDVRASLGALKSWFIEPLIIGMILLAELKDERERTFMNRTLLIALLWVALAGLLQLIGFRGTVEDGRLSSVFAPVANYYAMFAAPLIVMAVGLLMLRQAMVLALVSGLMGGMALFLSHSFGGYLAVAVGVVVLATTMLRGVQRRRVLVSIVLLSFLSIVFLAPTRYFQEKLNFTTRSSSLVRTQIWRTALEIGRDHPFLGIGANTFEKAYRETVPRLYFPPLEWLVAKPHSLYLNLWVETGILGLIGTLGASVALVIRLLRVNREAAVLGAAFIAILAHGIVDTTMFKNDLAIVTGVIAVLGLSATVRNSSNATNN